MFRTVRTSVRRQKMYFEGPAMKVKRCDEHALVVVDWGYQIAGFAALMAIIFLVLLAKGVVRAHAREIVGSSLGLLVCSSLAYYAGKRSVFTFDLNRRELVWSRRELFRSKGGVVPFDQITAVTVESDWAGEARSSLTYRVVLKTSEGLIPVSECYGGGAEEKYEAIRTAICKVLNRDSAVQSDVAALS